MIKNASAAESKYRFPSARNPYSHRNGKAILFTGIRRRSSRPAGKWLILLQWGLDLLIEERCSCGIEKRLSIHASMGPRLIDRGKRSQGALMSFLSQLQWGLDLLIE